MFVIEVLQDLATILPPNRLMGMLLIVGVLAATASGWRQTRRDVLWKEAGGLTAMGVFALFIAVRPTAGSLLLSLPVGAIVIVALLWQIRRDNTVVPPPLRAQPTGFASWWWLALALALAVAFLFADLGGYSGWLMVWEPSVITGFSEALFAGKSPLAYAAGCLRWDHGLVSTGHHALLYGAPTYLAWHELGISVLTLRLTAAILAILSLGAVWLLGRKSGSATATAAAVVIVAVNPALVFYGRYGTSLSGTLLALTMATVACHALVAARGGRWWLGLAAGGACVVATLGYSPARVVVVGELFIIGMLLCRRSKRPPRSGVASLVIFVVFLAGWWVFEIHQGSAQWFVNARGEQVAGFLRHESTISEFLGREVAPEDVTMRDRIELTVRVVERTLPQLVANWTIPFSGRTTAQSVIQADPPQLPLYHGALLGFLVWGAMIGLTRPTSGISPFVFGWFAAISLPVLFTTRVDPHRLMLSLVPLALWTAVGVARGARTLAVCGLPRWLRMTFAIALTLAAASANSTFLYHRDPPRHRLAEAVLAEVGEIDGAIILGYDHDHRGRGLVELALLERMRHTGFGGPVNLPEWALRGLVDHPQPTAAAVEAVLRDAARATVILAPEEPFAATVAALAERGAHSSPRGAGDARFWRVDLSREDAVRPSPMAGVADRIAPPSGESLTADGRTIEPLAVAGHLEVAYGFAPPVLDAQWSGEAIEMGGKRYERGLGMHAWTRMVYRVPDHATHFVAVIGISDRTRTCSSALVTFEVRGENGEVLFDSGLVGSDSRPRRISVPVAGQNTVALVLTEAENGRDCDHGNWADPGFVIAAP